MSIDFKIQNKCDHIIWWERGDLQDDRRRIDIMYPVGSLASFQLRMNNVPISRDRYTLVPDSTSLVLSPRSYVYLREVTKYNEPLVEMKYNTLQTYCPKCAAVRYIDDVRYKADGDVFTVKDEFLLIQSVEKFIITRLRSNVFHTWIGTNLHLLVGQKITDFDLIRSKVREDVVKAVNDLKGVQAQYLRSGREMSPGEQFANLLAVDVRQDASDPTTVHALVKFTAQSGRTLELDQLLELSELRRR